MDAFIEAYHVNIFHIVEVCRVFRVTFSGQNMAEKIKARKGEQIVCVIGDEVCIFLKIMQLHVTS